MITLSSPLASSSRAWLQSFTGLSITTSATEIVPVWPPNVQKVTAESVETQENIEIIVHGGHYTPGGTQPVRGMFARGRTHPIAADASGLTDVFFRLAPEHEPLVELTCPDAPQVHLTIDFSLQGCQNEDAIELHAVDANGAQVVAVLHEESVGSLLSRVRNGEIEFCHLALPPRVKGKLFTGRDGIWDARLDLHASSLQAKTGRGLMLMPPAIAIDLKRFIRDKTSDVLIDFGAFGRLRSRDCLAGTRAARRLPAELRSRLMTFLFKLQRRSPSMVRAETITDAELLIAFSKTEQRGVCEPNWRVLSHALKEFDKNR
ncbi:hypothetical protein [Burkholderia stabilis]|uniref:hypothetical protein n=1 Tax=Burkholderia stabilis TaxID=95485 RepID=UPI00158C7D55|nr:hypothetical protein [Burkholderia stabilis]